MSTVAVASTFPEIAVQGEAVDAKRYIEPGTGLAKVLAGIAAFFLTLIGIAASYGILLIVILFYPLFAWYIHRKALALIHGSGIHVTQDQFPEIYNCVETFKQRLNIQKDLDVYIIQESMLNAFAVKYGKKNIILITDKIIQGCIESGKPESLAFIIGHEMGHIALEHNGIIRSWCRQYYKKLGRFDEYSADAIAYELVKDKTIAFYGLLLLTIGYALLAYVNPESLYRQVQEVVKNKYSKKAEKDLTHPLLLNRLHRVMVHQ